MADGLSIAASALGVAQLAMNIAKTLHKYIRDVKHAYEEVEALSSEVTLTGGVLSQINREFSSTQTAKMYTDDAQIHADIAIQQCNRALTSIVQNIMSGVRINRKEELIVSTSIKLRWPTRASTLEAIRGDLERSKSTLTLIITTLLLKLSKKSGDQKNELLQKVYFQSIGKQLKSSNPATAVAQTSRNPPTSIASTDKSMTVFQADAHTSPHEPVASTETMSTQFVRMSHLATAFAAGLTAATIEWTENRSCAIGPLQGKLSDVVQSFSDLNIACDNFDRQGQSMRKSRSNSSRQPEPHTYIYDSHEENLRVERERIRQVYEVKALRDEEKRKAVPNQLQMRDDSTVANSSFTDGAVGNGVDLPFGPRMADDLLRRWIRD